MTAGSADRPVRLSVLVTTYQHEAYIAEAVEGVLAQRHDVPFELLVGDDASTDRTREILAGYAADHLETMRLVLPQQNLGKGGNVLFGELIRQSRGAYIATLDGDDFWTSPSKLARQVAYLDAHPECSACFHNVLRRRQDASQPDVLQNPPEQSTVLGIEQLLDNCPVAFCSPMFRRGTIDPLPAWYFEVTWGDWPLYFLAAEQGEVHFLPDVMGVYRIHERGFYSGRPTVEIHRTNAEFYERLRGVVAPEHEAGRRRRLASSLMGEAREHERLGDRDAALRCLRASLRARPIHPWRRGTGDRMRAGLWLRLRAPAAWRRA